MALASSYDKALMKEDFSKMNHYVDYILEQAKNLLAIDSPSGYTAEVTAYLLEEYKRLGYKAELTRRRPG